jgi:hypothetical protein
MPAACCSGSGMIADGDRRVCLVVLATGAGAPEYIHTPVSWTMPGLSWIPVSVTWCPSVSVTWTSNGPLPSPEDAIQ